MNYIGKKALAGVFGLSLAMGLFPAQTFAAEPAAQSGIEEESDAPEITGATAEELHEDGVINIRNVYIKNPRIEPEETERNDSLDTDGNCALKDGNYVRYIDRVDLPDWALSFYDEMIEGADHDGVNDFFINMETDDGDDYVLIKDYGAFTVDVLEDDDAEIYTQFNEDVAYFRAMNQSFDRDYPLCFWRTGQYVTFYGEPNGDGTYEMCMYLDLNYGTANDYTTESILSDIEIRDERIKEILAGAPGEDAYKVKYFNDWLVNNNEYNILVAAGNSDGVANETWECISALKGQIGETGPVCEAYARAMKVLCDAAGIPCVLVNGNHHMWNYVEIGDTWYGMDATWNDPVIKAGVSSGAVSGKERNLYTLVGGDSLQKGVTFLSSHPVANQWYTNGTCFTNGPEISSTSYDWSTHVHNPIAVVTSEIEPGCESSGSQTVEYYCEGCGEKISTTPVTFEIDAVGHAYVLTDSQEATGYVEGYKTYTCSHCGDSYTETIPKLILKTPTATVSAAKATTSTRKITFTGWLDDYSDYVSDPGEYYTITAHGIVYMTASRLGSRELTFETTGRTKVTFGAYKADGSFCYTIRPTSVSTKYVARAFVTYTAADGSSVTVYSDPVTFAYNQ